MDQRIPLIKRTKSKRKWFTVILERRYQGSQGIVLGSVLFLVFINTLPDVIEVLIKLFADDAKIYAVVSNQIVETRVQNSLNRAAYWANIWRMLFNIIKCHHLHIGKHDRGIKYTMASNNHEIELEKVDSEKDLEVIIDQNLIFRDHINKNLGIIFRTFTFIDEEKVLNLCLVVNPIIVDGYTSLFNCTTAVRASDSVTVSS